MLYSVVDITSAWFMLIYAGQLLYQQVKKLDSVDQHGNQAEVMLTTLYITFVDIVFATSQTCTDT